MATTMFKCIFHMSLERLKPTISVNLHSQICNNLCWVLQLLRSLLTTNKHLVAFYFGLLLFLHPPQHLVHVPLYSSYLASGLFVLNVFTLCSKRFPKMFLIASQFYPIFSGHNSTSMYIKKGAGMVGGKLGRVQGFKGKYVYVFYFEEINDLIGIILIFFCNFQACIHKVLWFHVMN